MKKFLLFMVIVLAIAYFTKPSLQDVKKEYQTDNSISTKIRQEFSKDGDWSSFLDGLLSFGLSELSGLEIKLSEKDNLVFKEFYLIIHQKNQERYHKVLFALGAFTETFEIDYSLGEMIEIPDLSEFDGVVNINL